MDQVKNRPSGIPRPGGASKLPVLSKRSSQILTPTQQHIPEPAKPSDRPALSKRPSNASISRIGRDTTPAKPPTPRTQSTSGIKPPSSIRPPSTVRARSTRPPSRTLRRPTQTEASKRVTDDEEHQDQLGSLDGFRAASQQGFYDDDSPQEFVEPPAVDNPPMPKQRKPSRPSLSDRTVESLSSLPATPKERRRSSFFSTESPMGPPPRPGSSSSRPSSNGSRPGTSDGTFTKPAVPQLKKAPASAKPATRTSSSSFGFTPNGTRRTASTTFSSKMQGAKSSVPASSRETSPSKPTTSKFLAARPTKPRPALGDAFKSKPESNAKPTTETSSSSSALRQQIAAAKAAARKEREKATDAPTHPPSSSHDAYEYNPDADPFNQAPKDGKHMLRNRINAARMSGKLNIAAMDLEAIPLEVMQMYDAAAMEESKVSFGEVVDLTKLIAADNEIEVIGHDIFPDKSPEDYFDDEDTPGNQFGGLDMLDLHGNTLSTLPMGLRRLERLTSLNLSHNKLTNASFEIISQITSLKDLRIGHNNLSNTLPASITSLTVLETLDVQSNRLLALPESLRDCANLRVLNASANQLTTLPMEALSHLPLMELNASNNALIASLFPMGGVSSHLTLRVLNVANNSLAALTFSPTLSLPRLQTLDVTNNHLAILPSMTGWEELRTLNAGENKISELPEGFTELVGLRTVNLSGNDLRGLPPSVAKMEGLSTLVLSANPLRERKFLTINAADVKRDLRSRLEPEEGGGDAETGFHGFENGEGAGGLESNWKLSPNNTLDLSNQALTDESLDAPLSAFLSANPTVRTINLSRNVLTQPPPALELAPNLRVLDLFHNPLSQTPTSSPPITLESLTDLSLASCSLRTADPLLPSLVTPGLQTLNISLNRLAGPLPPYRTAYPRLTTLLASDNKFTSLSADSLRGLRTVDLQSNELEGLPAEVGLLWEEGLKGLEVGRNAFRVPGVRVLEKGTEGLCRWLRGRLPADQSGEGDEAF